MRISLKHRDNEYYRMCRRKTKQPSRVNTEEKVSSLEDEIDYHHVMDGENALSYACVSSGRLTETKKGSSCVGKSLNFF